MKILYAIQGTGNGHVSRAREIAPVLNRYADVDYLISGSQYDLELPVEITYRTRGMSLYFGKRGGVDLLGTFSRNRMPSMLREIRSLPVHKYDLILNDFEPVSAWAARQAGVRCISLSHQCALNLPGCPMPKRRDPFGMAILQHYAPASESFGFHFSQFHERCFTPVIRKDIRATSPVDCGHYTVYLPAYDDQYLVRMLGAIAHVRWEVFSKQAVKSWSSGNVLIRPVHDRYFSESMLHSAGVLCGAGFETPAEALYLGKKLMVIPMKSQFEQQCNAEALRQMGVPVIKSLKPKHLQKIFQWVTRGEPVQVDYPDHIDNVIETILNIPPNHVPAQ